MPGATSEIDLSNRPMAGVVDLSFDPVTRATLAEDKNYASLVWENDTIGARLIDELVGNRNQHNPVVSYQGGSYAYTNYAYKKVAGANTWTTEALLVEGNYMFYAPYNEEARARAAHSLTFPTTQVVDTEDEGVEGVDANTSAIKGFYENKEGHVFALGHAFVSADVDDPKVTPTMTHLYAYPQLTLKNGYKKVTENGAEDITTPESIEVDKIVISSSNIYAAYDVKNKEFINNLTKGYDEIKEGKTVLANAVAEGQWHKGLEQGIKQFRYAKTSDILKSVGTNEDIVIDFEPNKILTPGEEFSFHAVLPAAEYSDLKMTVVLAGDKTFYKNGVVNASNVYEADYTSDVNEFAPGASKMTYAPMHRYPVEEWDFPVGGNAATKATAGKLATFVVEGYMGDYKAPRKGIKTIGDFAEYLREVTNNTNKITEGAETFTLYTYTAEEANVSTTDDIYEGYAQLQLNKDLLDTIAKYLVDGSVEFTNKMTVKGAFTSNGRIEAIGGLKQLDNAKIHLGAITINGEAEFKGETSLAGTTINGNAKFNGAIVSYKDDQDKDVTSSATITGDAEFKGGKLSGSVSNKATFKSGEFTMQATAAKAIVESGTLNVENQLGEITVYNDAIVDLDQTNYTGKINLGKQNDNNTDYTDGNLNINKSQAELDVVFHQGDVTVAAGKEVKFKNAWTSTKATTLTNNGTINNDLIVADGNTYTHNEAAKIDGTLTNNGTVYNNGKLSLENNKDVVIGSETDFTKTDITAGTGRINNTALGFVTGTGVANQTIFYQSSAATENDAIWKDWTDTQKNNSKINTIRFAHKWTVNQNTAVPAYNYELASTSGVKLGSATLIFNSAKSVKVLANQTWEGLDKSISVIRDVNDKVELCADTNGKVYELTVTDINFQDGNGYSKIIAKAVATGGKIKLTDNVTILTTPWTITNNLEIDLNGKKLIGTKEGQDDDIIITSGKKLTVSNGNVETKQTAFNNDGGELKLTNVNVTGSHKDATLVFANGGKMDITGGKIECTNETESDMYVVAFTANAKGTINTTVVGKKRGALTVTHDAEVAVNGGTYKAGKFYGMFVGSNAEVTYDFATASFQGAQDDKDVCFDITGGKPTVNGEIVNVTTFKQDTVNEEK